MAEERRGAQRHRTLKGGLIHFNDGRSTVTCLVRNLSEHGALLKVESIIGIPDQIILGLEHGARMPAKVVWRRANELGITFDQP